MICPLCRETELGDDTGPTACPACAAGLEIDDRGECVFVDTGRPRMPIFGQACMQCGLVQQDKRAPAFTAGPLSTGPCIDRGNRPRGGPGGPGAGRFLTADPIAVVWDLTRGLLPYFLSTFWLEGSAPADRYLVYLITNRLVLRWDRSMP